jgi:hypothetical protein
MLSPTLCACGCLQPVFKDDALWNGFLHNHTAGKRAPDTPIYLIIDMGYKTPCWVWQGPLNKWGYAKIKRNRKTMGGHRLFYRAYIDPNLQPSKAGSDGLDHLCRIRKCVNPEHVEPTTCVENIRRGLVPHIGRWKFGKMEDHLTEIGEMYRGGQSQRQIAEKFGVCQNTISRILRVRRWKGIAVPVETRSPIKLTPEQVGAIRLRASSGASYTDLALAFNMGKSQIGRIVRGQSWKAAMSGV